MHPFIGGGEGTVPIKIIIFVFYLFLFHSRRAKRAGLFFLGTFCSFNGVLGFFSTRKTFAPLSPFYFFLFFKMGGVHFCRGGFFVWFVVMVFSFFSGILPPKLPWLADLRSAPGYFKCFFDLFSTRNTFGFLFSH